MTLGLDIKIPFESEKGNQYVLLFSAYQPLSNMTIPVVEVSLSLKKQTYPTNSVKVFSHIIEEIRQYLSERDVVLYYYYNNSPICYRNNDKRHFFSSQHLRNELFYALSEKAKPKNLLIKSSVIMNEPVGNYYINFIYEPEHQQYINILSKESEEYQE